MENREIAQMLAETADLMEIAGEDPFRIRSYRNGAAAIEAYPERIEEVLRNPNKKVTDIPGIGKGLAAVLEEIVRRGSFERRDELLARYPPTALELLKIQGLGPKSIAMIWEHFRVSTVDGLERLCREHKLQTLPRMGAKLEEKVLRSIAQYRQSAGRFLLHFAEQTAQDLSAYLGQVAGVERITPAGSLRRGKETVGDLDLLVTGPGAAAALEAFVHYPRVQQVLSRGENKASAKVGLEGLQVDLRALPRESFGAALQYFSGSKEHNIALRNRALRLGYSLNEYGLFRLGADGKATHERVAGETEEEIYERLGLDWIPPELRENQGEIEAAERHALPKLVTLADIRGDLHMHTTETDGRATLEEMAKQCRELGYQYLAITDHSKALAMANGLDEKRVTEFAARVRRLDGELGIRVFSGIECDIRRDGSMDLADDALAELDFVIASVHSHMNLEVSEMTDRLLRAVECRYVRALGHPTGRVLLHRDGYPFDFEQVARAAARHKVALEINASPERLDLHAPLIRLARSLGCKFVISTDAHHPKHLLHMRFGVSMARRGWLTAADVWNTLPVEEFEKVIRWR
ncbi:MAG: DNA polymerase/3'-5' exonuclease PolX [Bryobacteraceae bacterium]|nr:DNA polymerase/3'-5' exonuclease PolX [Bryobacteraceae bacterium]MDW8377259.1 DNA polymerase/3'-5' exonuclease PolX [Bryobacterales bacterium]